MEKYGKKYIKWIDKNYWSPRATVKSDQGDPDLSKAYVEVIQQYVESEIMKEWRKVIKDQTSKYFMNGDKQNRRGQ